MIEKLDILAIGVHPDDVELGCGGVILKEISKGKKVGILDLTMGELGTRGSAKLRIEEADNAAKILGVSIRKNLKMYDGFFENSKQNKIKIIKIIRKYRPEIVLTNAIDDRHPDHARASKMTSEACFLSGLVKVETHFEEETQQPWRPKNVFHYIQWRELKPDFVVDISGFIDSKIESVLAYKSQFYDKNSKEKETPITSKNFLDSVNYRAQNFGRIIGVEHGEGFTNEKLCGVDSVFDLK